MGAALSEELDAEGDSAEAVAATTAGEEPGAEAADSSSLEPLWRRVCRVERELSGGAAPSASGEDAPSSGRAEEEDRVWW